MSEADPRQDLRADCGACAALCCVAPPFAVSADFPINKSAGTPCPHLTLEYRCDIHERLRQEGFSGCAAFDCFGAGQRTTHLMGDLTWRRNPGAAGRMFQVFEVLRPLHEILWYLEEACGRLPDGELREEARGRRQHTRDLAASSPDELIAADVVAQQAETGGFLEQVSRVLRGDTEMGIDLRGADLAGRRLRRADLRRADLRSACLIRTDLRGADLRLTDLLGADLRGADLRGANLGDAVFVTQFQVQAAVGDVSTTLPPVLIRPPHWSSEVKRPRGK
jgi:Pentapeptide repeats (8 copies)